MAKRDITKFLEECIETCWSGQKALVDETSDEYKELTAKIEAYQDVYAHLNGGDEYGGEGGSEVLDEDRPSIDEGEEKEKAPAADDDEDEEDDDQENEKD
jgi:hypothetical protein